MKNLGIVAIFAGILAIVLALVGAGGQGGAGRAVMLAAVILLGAGFFLYKRGQRPPAQPRPPAHPVNRLIERHCYRVSGRATTGTGPTRGRVAPRKQPVVA